MSEPGRIVVAEDESADALLLRHAFTKAKIENPVEFARDGQEAIALLQENQRGPVLLLLDLRMPRVNGFQVLEWLRAQPSAPRVSVVVLSSSRETEDICRAAALGAGAYVVKPDDPLELERVVQRLKQFWEEQCAHRNGFDLPAEVQAKAAAA